MDLTDADVVAYRPLIRRMAFATIRKGCPRSEYDDLIAVGMGALVHAARTYDPEHGTTFGTWAISRVRGDMLHWWRDRCLIIHIPHPHLSRWQELPRAVMMEEMPEQAVGGVDVDWLAVRLAMEQLPDEDRVLLTRYYLHGVRQQDLAHDMGISVVTVQYRTARALARLRRLLGGNCQAAPWPQKPREHQVA